MAVHIELDSLDKIRDKLGLEVDGPIQAFLTQTCANYMDKYIPKGDTEMLRNEKTLTNSSITYEQPYASYQYYGEREDGSHKVKNYTTPGTGPYWDRAMMSAESEDVIKDVQDEIDRRR